MSYISKTKKYSKKQVFVRTLCGKTILLRIPHGVSEITYIQQKIQRRTKIPVSKQRIICAGKPLKTGDTIENGTTLHLTLRLKGGFIADILSPIIAAIVATIIITVAITWRNFFSGLICAITKGKNAYKCVVFYFLFLVFNICYFLFIKIPLFIIDAILGTDFMGMWNEFESFILEIFDYCGELAPNVKNSLDENVFSCFRC